METPKHISINYDQIKNTEFFKGMTKIQQKIYLNGNNRRVIEHGVNVVENIGFEEWKSQVAFNYRNQEIIKELTNN